MSSPAKPDLDDVLPRLNAMMREDDRWGDVAAYIPQLAKVDPAQFGIAVVTADGKCHVAGDTQVPFSVQSITKVFTLAIALGRSGDQLWHRVGRDGGLQVPCRSCPGTGHTLFLVARAIEPRGQFF